ncbi:MAG TPA: hypothetical protein VFL93_15685 [Longimicrobiaceae bacterium]|nr:hypothetical protein [Longimicrobiaceae bacterium]
MSGFPELAAEQQSHFWRFLVRCAAKALHEMGISVREANGRPGGTLEQEIAAVLAGLAPEGAWILYQPDPVTPGFLQIPTPDGQSPGKGNNYGARSLGLLTSVLGGKNHERKSDVARELTPEQTVYAVIEYQLSAVFGGRGNYETQLLGSRSGAGSGVPFMGARIGDSYEESFRHDVGVLLDGWAESARQLGGDTWALWAEPWDGRSQLGSERLDPAFIPIARMIRLDAPRDGRFHGVWFRPTDVGRVRDHTDGGVLGDPLTPLVPDPKTGSPKVRGALRKGYDYTEVVRLLFGSPDLGGTPSPSVRVLAARGDDQRTDLRVVFEGTAYEQGKTGGFHHREVLLPPSGTDWISDPAPVRLAHERMLQDVRDAKGALRGSARILLNGELRKREGDAAKTDAFAALLEQRVNASYLGHLWNAAAAIERGEEGWSAPWAEWLSYEAIEIFRSSLGLLPSSTGRRFEREISAEQYLQYKLAKLRGEISDDASDEMEVDAEPTEEEERPA